MILKLIRVSKNPEALAVFGELYIDDTLECLTLERLDKIIPPGEYAISFYFSPHNQMTVPLLTVPNREYIEIHPANYPLQLLGCIAPGMTHNDDSISNSRFAFTELMSKIENQEDLSVVVSEEF